MPPVSAAKPVKWSKEALMRWSALETTGPFQFMCISPVNAVCIALGSGFLCLRSRELRLSWNVPKFQKSPNLSEIFPNFIRKFSRLSGNSPDCQEILQPIRKSSRLVKNLLDCPEIFQTVRNIFQTVQKSFTPSRNSPDCPEITKTVWKSSRLSGNLQDCLEIFLTVQNFS